MCTAIAAQRILDALTNRTKNSSVFTAYDVTIDARDGTDDDVKHGDSRRICSEEFLSGEFPDGYDRELVDLDVDGKPSAMVYYPDGKSPKDHPKAVQTGSATRPAAIMGITPIIPIGRIPAATVAQKTAAPKTKQGGKKKDGNGFICNVTCDGRVNVPKDLYSQVSPDGGTFDVQFNGSILYKKPIGSEERLVLKKSDLKGGSQFKVGVDVAANTITVEQI